MTPPTSSPPIERLVEHRAWLHGVARALVRDESAAADLEQDVWLDALRSPPHDPSSPRGWLARVLRRNAVDAGRSDRRRARRETAAARPEAVVRDPSMLAAEAETLRRVADAVLELEEPYRGAVLLRWFEGLPPREIAARQGIPVETVRTRLKRALATLRARLDAESGGDRSRWTLALAPFVGGGPAAPVPAPRPWWVAAACAAGLLGAVGAVVTLAVLSVRDASPSAAGGVGVASAEAGADIEPDAASSVAARAERPRAAPRSAANVASAAAEYPADTWLVIHVLGEDDGPVTGATLRIEVDDPPAGTPPSEVARVRAVRGVHAVTAGSNPFLVRGLPASLDTFYMRVSAWAPGHAPPEPEMVALDASRTLVTRVVLAVPRTAEVRVVDDATGTGIAGATVWSETEIGRRGVEVETIAKPSGDGWGTADDAGTAAVGGLGRGRHAFVADAPGYAPSRVSAAATSAPVTVRLTAIPSPGRARVVVGGPDGKPFAGARLRLSLGGDGRGVALFRRTDAKGEALFDDLPAGWHTVQVEGGTAALGLVAGATPAATAVPRGAFVTAIVKPGEEVRVLAGWSSGPARAAVRILDASGRPAAGVTLQAWFGARTTGADGLAVWEGLEAGEEVPLVLAGEGRTFRATTDGGVADWSMGGACVEGTLRRSDGAPLAGTSWLSVLSRGRFRTCAVEPDGRFRVDGVAPGERLVLVATNAHGQFGRTTVEVPARGAADPVEILLRRTGTVRALAGSAKGVSLRLVPADDAGASVAAATASGDGAGAAGGGDASADDAGGVAGSWLSASPSYSFGPDPDRRGNLVAYMVPPGRYVLTGRADGRDVRRDVEVREGEETVVDLR